jgi:hypothetical protein
MGGLIMRTAICLRAAAAASLTAVLLSCVDADGPTRPELALSPALSLLDGVELLHCPLSFSASSSATIGSGGGSLSVNGHELRIPEGAVTSPQKFTVAITASEYLELDIRADGHDHYVFAKPVRITVSFDRCVDAALLEDELRVYYIDPDTKDAIEDVGGTVNTSDSSIAAWTDHLSDYAVGSPH